MWIEFEMKRRIHKGILAALSKGRSKQAVYQEISRKRQKHKNLISREDAAYILASEKGIDLYKHLSKETIERIRILAGKSDSGHSVIPIRDIQPTKLGKEQHASLSVSIIERSLPRNILSDKLAREAKEMSDVYSLLYILENSIRHFISTKLQARHGRNWWDKASVSRGIKEEVQKRRVAEDNNRWHGRRGAHSIFYTNIADLSRIIVSNWDDFRNTGLSSAQWVEFHIKEIVEVSRNTVMHNNPLSKRDIRRLRDVFEAWMDIIGDLSQDIG